MKTKIILKFKNNEKSLFGLGTLRFDKKSFFHTLLGFEPYWDYKPTNSNHVAIRGVYTSDKFILNLNTKNKIRLKCDCIDDSIQVSKWIKTANSV